MAALWQDLRFAGRMLRKSPGFTVIALITLAIGIGANTIMFSISDLLLLLHPRKVKAPEQLAYCAIQNANLPHLRYSGYVTLRDSRLAFSDILAEDMGEGPDPTLVHGESARQVSTRYVSANYFSVLGVAPARGRAFLPEEERPGSAPVVVLSHRLWQRLGSDPKLVDAFVRVNGAPCQVVGVAPEGFTGTTLYGPDLWAPLGSYRVVSRWGREQPDLQPGLNLVGRLKPDLTMGAAQAQLQALAPRFKLEYPKQWTSNSSLALRPPGRFMVDGDIRQDLRMKTVFSLVLMAASALILVIACLNLANMLIVQGAARHREIAVRLALGGGRWRIVRQLLIESGLLALLGGIFGVLLAFCGMRILNVWIADVHGPLGPGPRLNVRVLAATLGVCLIATLLFGLRPALWLSQRDIAGEMKEAAGRVLGSLGRKRGGLSVAGQIALAVALVLSAALLTHSALQLARPDPRFPLEDKLLVQIDPLSAGYNRAQSLQACETLADHLVSLPDVRALGTSTQVFFGGGGPALIYEYRPAAEESGSGRPLVREAAIVSVGRDYFTALQIPLLRGRLFDRLDSAPHAEKVAIIDESLARKLRPDGNALGCYVQWGLSAKPDSDLYRVVGIVAHVPGVGDREAHGQMYEPAKAEQLSSCLYLQIANGRSADLLRRRIVEEIHRVDARVSVLSATTLAQKRHDNFAVWLTEFGARLALTAATAALFLAALGIYAIKGYMVASRAAEIGIRKALGATHRSIMVMVLREGLAPTVVGLTVGLLLGLGVAKVSAQMLYGISPVDPVSIIATVVLLGVTSLLAGYVPARRAAKVDPMVALRCE